MGTAILFIAFGWMVLIIILLLNRLMKNELFARRRENIGMCINGILLAVLFTFTRDAAYVPFITIPFMIVFIVLLCIVVSRTRNNSNT
ncbi:hypothetical protein ASF12_07015 [Paenibacillus sp. Leaf72]|nr:hypothetical protein ASF12_07015 [Paenibacillus sp. Leaf72]